MNDDLSRKRLGRGLAALIGEIENPAGSENSVASRIGSDKRVPIEFVGPNPRNPRRSFGEADLADLTQSIREHGVVQPVIVRTVAGGRYEIIAGERRWRAAQRAGLTELPVIIREVDDRVALELAIIENVQRADLNPVEEAAGYQQLIDEHNYTQADLGQVIGKSRSHVANTLRLLKLPDIIRDLIVDGSLSSGHARTLITSSQPVVLARRIIDEGLSVRQAEALAQQPDVVPQKAGKNTIPAEKDVDTLALEKALSDVIGLKVTINHGQRRGELKIAYKTLDQLDELCRRLQG